MAARVYALSTFLKETFSHKPLLAGDLLDSGEKAVVFGPSESGKSYWVLQLGLCLASGESFLGYEVLHKCRVLIIQSELSERRYQERCAKLAHAFDTDLPLFVWTVEDLKVDVPENRARLMTVLQEVKPDVLIIDPLRAFFQGNENDSQSVEHLFNAFAILQGAVDTPFAIIYAHHVRKTAPGFSREAGKEEARGTGLITDRPSTAFSLEINESQTEWKLTAVKTRNRDKHPPPMLMGIDPETGLFVPTGTIEKGPDFTFLVDYVGEGRAQSLVVKWLQETRKISSGHAYRMVEHAVREKALYQVSIPGSNRWMLYTEPQEVDNGEEGE